MSDNLPPGMSLADIPGNRPIDEAIDNLCQAVDTVEEVEFLLLMIKAYRAALAEITDKFEDTF